MVSTDVGCLMATQSSTGNIKFYIMYIVLVTLNIVNVVQVFVGTFSDDEGNTSNTILTKKVIPIFCSLDRVQSWLPPRKRTLRALRPLVNRYVGRP